MYEHFIDRMGDVNYTVTDGSTWEGKDTLSLSATSTQSQSRNIEFALSIGAYLVLYYVNKDGSIPQTIEELYDYDNIQAYVLYDGYDYSGGDNHVSWMDLFDIGFGINIASAQTPDFDAANNNLTVDTLQTGETDDIYRLTDMIENSTALIDTTQVHAAADTNYVEYSKYITDWSKEDELYETPDDDAEPKSKLYGTENMTQTTYTWLARYIEDTDAMGTDLGIDPFTVTIDDGTETIDSESVTVALDENAHAEVRKLVDEALTEAGVDGYGGFSVGNIGSSVLSKITKKKGSFSFSKGMSVSSLISKGTAITKKAIGSKTARAVALAAVAPAIGAAVVAKNVLGSSKFVQKASAKTSAFFSGIDKKLENSKFGFVGSIYKKIKKTVNLLLKYWWLWLGLIILGFVMFATPVGPFIMSNTIRKIIPGRK